jgi:penicillin-binding protein 2
VEHGGFGSTSAAPIAKAIMDAWLLPKPTDARAPAAAPTAAPGSVGTPQAPARVATPVPAAASTAESRR